MAGDSAGTPHRRGGELGRDGRAVLDGALARREIHRLRQRWYRCRGCGRSFYLLRLSRSQGRRPGHATYVVSGVYIRDLVGPYISQFLLQDIQFGTTRIPHRHDTVEAGVDYMTDFDEWLAIQHRRLRPEAFGGRIEVQLCRDPGRYNGIIDSEILNWDASNA